MDTRLAELLRDVRCVSLDIFDTAVVRAVPHPTDVFGLVAAGSSGGDGFPFDYRHARVEAEREARDLAWRTRQSAETTLDEIYERLTRAHRLTSEVAEALKCLEIEVEEAVCIRDPAVYELYQSCREQGKRIVFSSDMYLPVAVVRRILDRCGYSEHEGLFLSSDLGVTKSTGELYLRMLAALGETPEGVLHVGDNRDSDVSVPSRLGLRSYHYEKCVERTLSLGSLRRPVQRALRREGGTPEERLYLGTLVRDSCRRRDDRVPPRDDVFWRDVGYRYVGILFLGFCQWLRRLAAKDQIEHLLFLSRDGYVLKQVYDLLVSTGPGGPPSSYMYASRRALNVPAIVEIDDHAMDFLVSGTSTLTVAQFLGRLGLDSASCHAALREAGFRSDRELVVSGADYANLRRLYTLLSDDIKAIAAAERDALMAYLGTTGLLSQGRFGLVDIGWHGTLQHSLEKLVRRAGSTAYLKGYYLGTFSKAQDLRDHGQDMSAYLCEFGQPERFYRAIRLCVEIFEFVHAAPHGSVVKFARKGGEVEPVLDRSDLDSRKLLKAQAVQRGALQFIADSAEVWGRLPFVEVSRELAIGPLVEVLRRPSYREAVMLGDLEHAEGFGDVYVKRPIARPPPLGTVFSDPYGLVRGYREAFWRTGYRKRILSVGRRARSGGKGR